ncbi:MAG: MaoC family dehydratase N-terminal domain-containing protein, partial [Thermodesulfobacteriota bacterium]|nr:MaoC family dehydratase N-terminal domain-containing protein [Thermodesulfobacteriota bacterium]
MADLSKIGTEYSPIIWEVERGKIREFAKAIGDPNPVYLDKEAAIAEGYKDTPAPPTFLTVPM